jgi:cell division septum initiation protein DivIVA
VDIDSRLQQIQEIVEEAKSMPLSSSVLVNREEVLELIGAARDDIPEEVKQARWVVKDREELLAKARRDGEQIVQRAREEHVRLVAEEEVVRGAQAEAERILNDAAEQARRIKLEAEDYVDAKLAGFEAALEQTAGEVERSISQVRRGRELLRGPSPAEEAFGVASEVEEEGA